MGKSAELREQALQGFKDAKALVNEQGEISAEDMPRFEELMANAMEADKQHEVEAKRENLSVGKLDERLTAYTAEATGGPGMQFNRTVLDPQKSGSLGSQFVNSDAYKQLASSRVLESDNGKFDTGRIVLNPYADRMGRMPIGAAATDEIHTESGGPANALVLPEYLPGILPLPQRPLTIRGLFSQANMTSGDTLSYAAQSGFDSGASTVLQATSDTGPAGSVKPQSSIAWERRTSPAEWIATYMVATRQALADAGVIAGLIDNQGRLMLQLEEEDQILSGDGVTPNLEGILNVTGVQTLDLDNPNLDNLDGIRTARTMVQTGVSRSMAEWVVMNPTDAEEFDLLQDANGIYRGGNPIGNFNYGQTIWRLQRVESEAITAGTVLVGNSAGATVYERQPITVLTTDSHADFFVRNLIVVLFEERLAFPVFWPSAYVDVTLDQWV